MTTVVTSISNPSDTQLGDCGYEKWENGLKAGLVSSMVAVGNTEMDSIRALSKGEQRQHNFITLNIIIIILEINS